MHTNSKLILHSSAQLTMQFWWMIKPCLLCKKSFVFFFYKRRMLSKNRTVLVVSCFIIQTQKATYFHEKFTQRGRRNLIFIWWRSVVRIFHQKTPEMAPLWIACCNLLFHFIATISGWSKHFRTKTGNILHTSFLKKLTY